MLKIAGAVISQCFRDAATPQVPQVSKKSVFHRFVILFLPVQNNEESNNQISHTLQ